MNSCIQLRKQLSKIFHQGKEIPKELNGLFIQQDTEFYSLRLYSMKRKTSGINSKFYSKGLIWV